VPVPLLSLVAFLAVQFAIGVWISRRIVTEDDYLVGGRRFGYLLATFSIFATWFGAETVIGSSGTVYTDGLSLASAEPFGYGLCLVLMGALLARPLWNRGLTTLADLYRQRFGVGVERLAALVLIPSSVLWAGAQVRAFGNVISSAGGFPVDTAIGIAALVTVAYTVFGGLLADAVTDVLQGTILSVALVILCGAVLLQLGGMENAVTAIRTSGAINLTPQSTGPWIETLEAWAIPVLGSLAATEVIGRVIAARTATVAQRSSLAAGALYLVVGSVPVLIALMARPLVPDLADPEQLLPAVAQQLLPPLLYALFAGGLVSAILSTVDSTLLVASGLVTHNLIIPVSGITSEAVKVRLARGGVFTFGVIAYVLAMNAEGVFALVEQASAFGSAGIVVTVLFALFTRLGSATTAAITLVSGIAVYSTASLLHSTTPFLLSLAGAFSAWWLGCAIDALRHRVMR
jgi:Na+/proline symporter